MPDTKISLLGSDTQPTGSEIVPMTQSGTTVKGTAKQVGDLGPYYNVKAYGAVADYSISTGMGTDDHVAIQAAINAAQSAGGGVVYFPRGDYYITTGLVINASGVTLLGAGMIATSINVAHNATIVPITISTAGAISGNVNTYAQNAQVRDLTLNMALGDNTIGNIPATVALGAANNTHAIDVLNFVFPKLINVEINNFGLGVYVSGTYNMVMSHVFIVSRNASATSGYGFYIDGAFQNASFYAEYCFCVYTGFTGTTSYGWVLIGPNILDFFLNYCEGDDTNYGIYINGNSGGSVALVDVHLVQFIADGNGTMSMYITGVANSTYGGMIDIDGGWTGGISIVGSQGVTIRGVENPARLISVDATSSDCSISNCIFTGTNSFPSGIAYSGTNGTITGNVLALQQTGTAIAVGSAAKEIAISGNMIRGKGATLAAGISVASGATGISVVGNAVEAASVTTPVSVPAGAGNVSHANTANTGTTATPSVSSGVAFTPSTASDSMLYLKYATTGTVTSVTMGPSTGAENTVSGSQAVTTSYSQSLRVPVGWKVVVTLVTTTATALVVAC